MNRTRTEQTLLNAAMDFVAADLQVQLARSQRRELQCLHPDGLICCLWWRDSRTGEECYGRPRRKWCKDCKRISAGAVPYNDALDARRASKVRMKRAYKKLIADPG